MNISYYNHVAIVTGAGAGLGRSHAIALAARGAKVVVNDLGNADGSLSQGALDVVAEIQKAGGEAIANGANVANIKQVQTMVEEAMTLWSRVDILVNNAGILRDKSFGKMSIEDFDVVRDGHVMG